MSKNEYKPDFVTHPGETFLEIFVADALDHMVIDVDLQLLLDFMMQKTDNYDPSILSQITEVPKAFWENRIKRYKESVK